MATVAAMADSETTAHVTFRFPKALLRAIDRQLAEINKGKSDPVSRAKFVVEASTAALNRPSDQLIARMAADVIWSEANSADRMMTQVLHRVLHAESVFPSDPEAAKSTRDILETNPLLLLWLMFTSVDVFRVVSSLLNTLNLASTDEFHLPKETYLEVVRWCQKMRELEAKRFPAGSQGI